MILAQTELIPGLTGNSEAAEKAAEASSKFAGEMSELRALSFEDLMNRLADSAVNFAINLAVAILVFYLGRFVIRKIYKLVNAIFLRRRIDRSLSTFLLSLINIVLYFILIVTVIGILGIETTSFLALFASAGVAVGMALSGTLQNFAGGVLILLLKPYKIGDYIEVQGYAGTVKEIQIFFTVITTYDNKSISIPNGSLSTGSVNNWSREEFRRVTWSISISYGDDVTNARSFILSAFEADERVLAAATTPERAEVQFIGEPVLPASTDGGNQALTPAGNEEPANKTEHRWYDFLLSRHRKARRTIAQWEEKRQADIAQMMPKPDYTPKIYVDQLADSAVVLTVRAWTKTADYWDVYYYYNELFYTQLPKHNIHFPFPQMDVHINPQKA